MLNASRTVQGGFTLIELLIALLVLSIGFAGYAALQVVGIRSVQDSYQRSQMTVLMEELVERMRANRQGADSYADLEFTEGDDQCDEIGPAIIDNHNCERADWQAGDDTCVAAEQALYDVARVFCGFEGPPGTWMGGIANISEEASISIVADPAVAGGFLITGTWLTDETDQDDSRSQDADGDNLSVTQTVVMSVTP